MVFSPALHALTVMGDDTNISHNSNVAQPNRTEANRTRENAISGVNAIKTRIMVFHPALPALAKFGDEQILAVLVVSLDPR